MANGKFRWVIFVFVLFTYLFMSSQRTAPGLITDQLMTDFAITASTVGLIASMQFLMYTSLQVPVGLLADRYGPNLLLIAGTMLTGIGTIIYSVTSYTSVLFFARILTGIGDATIWVNLVLILSKFFNEKEFTKLIGVAGMTGSLGLFLATAPFSIFIEYLGWRSSFLFMGILLVFCSVILYFLLVKVGKDQLIRKKEGEHVKIRTIFKDVCKSRQAWALFVAHFGVVGGYVGFIGSWAVPYGMTMYGLSHLEVSQLMMMSLTGALIGAPFIGWLSSRLGRMKLPFTFFHFIMLSCWSVFFFYRGHPPYTLLVILFFIIGFSYGSNSLTFALVRQTISTSQAGFVSGFANTGGFLSAVLLPSLFGKILDSLHASSGHLANGYFYSFIIPVLFSLIGIIGVFFIKEKKSSYLSKSST